jgi:hypothetical protein
MSTTYIARVFISHYPGGEASVMRALSEVAQTATFHGGAWTYEEAALGALLTFDVGMSSPYSGRCEALRMALRKALRALVGPKATVDVALLDADRAAWYRGPEQE